MSHPSLSELTLCVPTYGRQPYALRQMQYWSGKRVRLLVIDGSASAISCAQLAGLGTNVEYSHLPASIYERLLLASERVQTPYAALLCDDEFFMPNGLEQCLGALAADPELVACLGRCMVFIGGDHGMQGQLGYRMMRDYEIVQSHPVERMNAHMNPYTPSICYAVMRSSIWKPGMELMSKCAAYSSCPAIAEIQFELTTCYKGKSKVLPVLTWLRSQENAPVSKDQFNRNVEVHEWLEDPRFQDEVSDFFVRTAAYLSPQRGVQDGVVLDLRQAVDRYVEFVRGLPEEKPPSLFALVKSLVPQGARTKLKSFLHRLGPAGRLLAPNPDFWRPLDEIVLALREEGVTVDRTQLEEIARRVGEFHHPAHSGTQGQRGGSVLDPLQG